MIKKERYCKVFEWFAKEMPVVDTELVYHDPFGLLVAVILSAQCTDKRVNVITPPLLHAFPDAVSMAKATEKQIYAYVKSCSYPNSKTKYLKRMSEKLVQDFDGKVPSDSKALQSLPGVGRKTANVIMSVAFKRPTMAVDTHVFRVAERIGLSTNAKTPLQTEKQLLKYIPKNMLPDAHHWLILHGRYVCTARSPKCSKCGLKAYCKYYAKQKSR
ncbi:MAG: endonuclease III [Bacteroidota bacterium]|nr:endonuclease III [Bacteroidota bacterium]